ncbi:MAG: sodium:proton antiporter [Prevotella sp.]|nr:sodium:proton antiporter [Prevotella sp.]
MTLIIVAILLIGYLLIATSSMTKINRAASAIFAGTVGWVLYICYGSDFVMSQHPSEYIDFLGGASPTSVAVKEYISQNVFLKYVGRGAEIVLFLLATMTIVEVLNNNGCFDFFKEMFKTRKSKRLLWVMTLITFFVSANLDNLTVTTMMLVMMHEIVPNRRQRMIYGSAIVIAANCGGALTVIGDPTGLVLWTKGSVTATNFSASLAIPCLLSWLLPTWWLSRMLPEHIDSQWTSMPYRGDDTNLKVWQRLLMLIVGIGGLWFIPSFRAITKLSPFLGALCVLAVLWIVNEIVNRKLMNTEQMIQRRTPRVLQYGVLQLMLFVMGITLALGVVQETGAIAWLSRICDQYIHNIWIMGALAGVFSTVLDTFATSMSFFSLYPSLSENAMFYKIVAYSTAMGGSVLLIGSVSGLALMKMEHIHVGWFLKNVGWVVVFAWLLGILSLLLIG